jgi:hypothetical protein
MMVHTLSILWLFDVVKRIPGASTRLRERGNLLKQNAPAAPQNFEKCRQTIHSFVLHTNAHTSSGMTSLHATTN